MPAKQTFLSGWHTTPNGGTQYRLSLRCVVISQNRAANQSTVGVELWIEKNRSGQGFYDYTATWQVSADGAVMGGSTEQNPTAPWTGWSAHQVYAGRKTVTHDDNGTLTIPVSGFWHRTADGWSPGNMDVSGNWALPSLTRATVPKITPSTASVGSTVTIDLPRAVGTYTHNVTWKCGALAGTIGTGLGTSTTWTVPSVMGQPLDARGFAPITVTVVTMNGATNIGSNQATLLAKSPPSAPVIHYTDPDMQYDVRVRLVTPDGPEWTGRQIIPADSIQVVDPYSATSTCTLKISQYNYLDFEDFSLVDTEVFNGTDWQYAHHRFVLTRTEVDDADPLKMGTYTGVEFVDYILGFAYTQYDYEWGVGTNITPPASPGAIMKRLIDDAKARGWGPRLSYTFDGGNTSTGETWANTAVSRKIATGTPLSQILEGFVEDGLLEYQTEYKNGYAWLVLLNPGTGANFADDGADPVVNFSLAAMTRAPRRSTSEKRLTRVTVQGDDKVKVTRESAPFDSEVFGHMEGWVSASGVDKADSAKQIGDNALRDNGSSVSERTFEYNAQDVGPAFYPYGTFQPGDWVLIPDSGGSFVITDRISQITIDKQPDSFSLSVVTGDRILSGTASLAKRQSAQTGGSIGMGNGYTVPPLDSRIPSGPVVLSVTSEGYWGTDGTPLSAVTIDWAEVTTAINDAELDVDLYEVWWRRSGTGEEWQLRGSTKEDVLILGAFQPGQDVDLRARARSAAGIWGEFSEDQEHTTAEPTSSIQGPDLADLYTNGVGSIYAVWGGTVDGVAPPAWLAYVVAEISSDGGTVYTQKGTPIVAAGQIVINPGVYGEYMVRLRAFDKLGNPGEASDPQTILTTDPHVDPPIPVKPTGLVVTPGAGWDASAFFPQDWFDLNWDDITVDVDGNPIAVAGYDVWGLRAGDTIEKFITSTQTTSGARVYVKHDETWTYRIRATSSFGGTSDYSDPVSETADAGITAAPAPTAPTLEQYAGILRIKWAGGGMQPYIKYVYAMISTTVGGTYTRIGPPMIGAGDITVTNLAPGPYYAKIVMVDEVGNLSTSPASSVINLLPITGVTIQTSEIANTGIKMTSAALTAYDASGQPTFVLDATTGEVTIVAYASVFNLGAPGETAEINPSTGEPDLVTGVAISSENSSFNTFIHPSGVQIRNDLQPVSWWETPVGSDDTVFVSPYVRILENLKVGDYEFKKESKSGGSRLVIRYLGS